MRELPILFSAAMVRAILDGRKTQTRRAINIPAGEWTVLNTITAWHTTFGKNIHTRAGVVVADDIINARCPYGQPGDRLWVRENGWERPERTPKMMREGADTWAPYYYDADGLTEQDGADFKRWGFKRRPSIHMPRWASRITIELTAVRVERLNTISEADAIAEGTFAGAVYPPAGLTDRQIMQWRAVKGTDTAVEAYLSLWESINGPRSWALNPWVWVVEFKRV